jgi:hypothetical protein
MKKKKRERRRKRKIRVLLSFLSGEMSLTEDTLNCCSVSVYFEK